MSEKLTAALANLEKARTMALEAAMSWTEIGPAANLASTSAAIRSSRAAKRLRRLPSQPGRHLLIKSFERSFVGLRKRSGKALEDQMAFAHPPPRMKLSPCYSILIGFVASSR